MVESSDLRDVAVHLQHRVDALFGTRHPASTDTGLDAKSHALVRLAVLHGLNTSDATYQNYVTRALAAGCTPTEVLGTLIAVGTLVGEVKAVSNARPVALALGYDVDAAIETGQQRWPPESA